MGCEVLIMNNSEIDKRFEIVANHMNERFKTIAEYLNENAS